MKPSTANAILNLMRQLADGGQLEVSRGQIVGQTGESSATVNRHLRKLLDSHQVQRIGNGAATRYQLAPPRAPKAAPRRAPARTAPPDASHAALSAPPSPPAPDGAAATPPGATPRSAAAPEWSAAALALRATLGQALGARRPVSYQRHFVDGYIPNTSHLLPQPLAEALFQEGRMAGQLPASTYARKVLEQLLIDLSWTSSWLEGNRYTLLDTKELFTRGQAADAADTDAVMLLNHKEAIEFLVDAVPTYGLGTLVVRNVHSLLMNGLLPDVEALGAIRQKIVNISGTVYLPLQNPHLLGEMLGKVVELAAQVKNPVEAAFFLWLNLAYLQPFDDGNKRVSRVCANIPLMLYNCAPLSFLDVAQDDYALAMMGVYELLDVSMAVELFTWTYRRSIAKYGAVLASLGPPDPFRARYRQQVGEAVRRVVEGGQTLEDAAAQALALAGEVPPEAERVQFSAMLRNDLQHLDTFNCARYRLSMHKTEEWVGRGRPLG